MSVSLTIQLTTLPQFARRLAKPGGDAQKQNMKAQHGHKLTRKYFMALAPYMFLVSGTCKSGPADPSFAEHVSAEPLERGEQWKRIVEAKANDRNCFVFINKQQWLNFLAAIERDLQ